jgi:putative molybdopterin biosynthesis protein
MDSVPTLHAFDKIKLLADPRRMEILRLLMASPATLTQLAETLHHSPAWVRHHLKILESTGLVEMDEVRKTGRVTEKYYRTKARAFLLQEIILPKSRKPAVIFSGSHDLALERIAEHVAKRVLLLTLPVGSLDGLINLRQGLCQISGVHILDESGEYNKPYVRRLFPGRAMEMITFAHRIQGLIVAAGNPKNIKRISHLVRPNIRFVNRNAGSGTRLWLDAELKKLRLLPGSIRGYQRMVNTHSEAAALIESGKADAALGLQAAAHQYGLDFVPLFEERYDLVLPRENKQLLMPVLDYLQTAAFRNDLNSLTGYNSAHSGEQIPL